jgi:hypothetical protein
MTKQICVITFAAWLAVSCSASADQTQRGSTAPATAASAPTTSQSHAQEMPKGSSVNPDAGLVADFKKRVDEYVKLQKDAADEAPVDLKKTPKPGEIAVAEKSLAQKIREARVHAKRGDIFTPATQAMFRRLLRPQLTKGPDAADNKAIIKDDAPEPKEVPFKVNAEYPKEAPLSTVPPDVLLTLPQLPKDVEYRFVGKHLILYDAKANLIIDFMLNALP